MSSNGVDAPARLLSPVEAIDRLLEQLRKPARLLVAISGGSDSTGLLLALHERVRLHFPDQIQLSAATVDHGLRPEARQEAEEVSALCQRYSIDHTILSWVGEKPKTGIAAAARTARYQLLTDLADRLGADALLTGHTLDDQLETVAMRQARGATAEAGQGTFRSGDAGMASSVLLHQKIWMVRPFLQTRRQPIRAFLQELGEGWTDDPSNENRASERVRTRLQLSGMGDDEAIHRMGLMTAAQAERERLAQSAAEWLSRNLNLQHQLVAHLPVDWETVEPDVLQVALSSLIAVMGGREHGPPPVALGQIVARIRHHERFCYTLGRVLLTAKKQGLYLVRETRSFGKLLLDTGETTLWDGRFMLSANKSVNTREDVLTKGAFNHFPPAVAEAAWQASWQFHSVSTGNIIAVSAHPILRPWMEFLPVFDLAIANSIAHAMGLARFKPSPLNALRSKT